MEHSADAARSQQTVGRPRHPDLNRRLEVRRRGLGAPLLPGRSVSPILDACGSGALRRSPERTLYGDRSPPSPLDLLKDFGNSGKPRRTERRPSLVRILEDSTATPIPEKGHWDEDVETARPGAPLQMSNRVITPPSPIDVLKEFSASTRRRQNVGRPGVATLHENTTPTKQNRRNPSRPWYEEASNNPSRRPNYNDDDMMHCTEAIVLPKTPSPFPSPLARRNRRQQRRLLGSKSYEASLYIDHLEYQLASAQSQLEVYTSPATTNIASTELRRLKKESETLRREVEDWEGKFEERVEGEVKRRVESETRLKVRIADLEEDVVCKEARVMELEDELEGAQRRVKEMERGWRLVLAKAKQMEVLEAANRDLEGRIDVLTGLLAHSQSVPTAPASPDRTVARSLPPRPRSMGEFGTERRMRRFHSGACTLKPLILPGAVEEPLRSGKSLAEELHGVGEDERLESMGNAGDDEVGSPPLHQSVFRRLWDAWRKGTQVVRRILGSMWTALLLRSRRFGWWLLGLFFGPSMTAASVERSLPNWLFFLG